jgi:hypothetical protein
MSAPFAVKSALVHDTSEKSQNAVVPEVVGVTLVSDLPPAVYAVPVVFVISFVVPYAVVEAPSVAALVNSAILNVSPVVAVKLWTAVKISDLKLVAIAVEIAIVSPS